MISAQARRSAAGYELGVIVEQTQPGPAYELDLPVAVTLAGQQNAYSTVVRMKEKRAELRLQLKAQPLRVDWIRSSICSAGWIARRFPPAFSQVFGAEKLLIVLPRKSPDALREKYRQIAEAWQGQPSSTTVIEWDDRIEHLPDTGAVWLFGWENAFRNEFAASLENNAALTDSGAGIADGVYESGRDALALAAHIGQTPAAWLAVPDAAMLPVLARKLPHYAKYSYAAFSGAEMSNLAKGVWPVTNSPHG